jgi:hypothetical protein
MLIPRLAQFQPIPPKRFETTKTQSGHFAGGSTRAVKRVSLVPPVPLSIQLLITKLAFSDG